MPSRGAYFGLGGMNGAFGFSSPYYHGATDTPSAVAHGLGFSGMHGFGSIRGGGGGARPQQTSLDFSNVAPQAGPMGGGHRAGYVTERNLKERPPLAYSDQQPGFDGTTGINWGKPKWGKTPLGGAPRNDRFQQGRGAPQKTATDKGPGQSTDWGDRSAAAEQHEGPYALGDVHAVPRRQNFSMKMSELGGSQKALPPGSAARTLGAPTTGAINPTQNLLELPRVGSAVPSTRSPRGRRSSFNPNQGSLF